MVQLPLSLKRSSIWLLSLLFCGMCGPGATAIGQASPPGMRTVSITMHYGMCDASAAINKDDGTFIVANDEDNLLRTFSFGQEGPATTTHPVDQSALATASNQEIDLEGATKWGDQIIWSGSHGRSRKGKFRPARRQIFTTGPNGESVPNLTTYTSLLTDLVRTPEFDPLNLANAAEISPKRTGGLNLEALAMAPDSSLWLGFRSPLIEGRALAIPLKQAASMFSDERVAFGSATLLDLGGRGIRAMEYWPSMNGYLIAGGHATDGGNSRLFFWGGPQSETDPVPLSVDGLPGLNVEGVMILGDGKIALVSDDGTYQHANGTDCKNLGNSSSKWFRLALLEPKMDENPTGGR